VAKAIVSEKITFVEKRKRGDCVFNQAELAGVHGEGAHERGAPC